MMSDARFPLMRLNRLRMGADGRGVTTLVLARGCPLRCRYCLNPRSWQSDAPVSMVTPRALYDLVRRDGLYFQATGGGVTFGGGEPLLHADFIRQFRALCSGAWRIVVETCLNIPETAARTAIECVDEFIVDIKDVNPDIYRRYTGADNGPALRNLRVLLEAVGPDRVRVRVPRIPEYNAEADVAQSVKALRAMRAERIEVFTYKTNKWLPKQIALEAKDRD